MVHSNTPRYQLKHTYTTLELCSALPDDDVTYEGKAIVRLLDSQELWIRIPAVLSTTGSCFMSFQMESVLYKTAPSKTYLNRPESGSTKDSSTGVRHLKHSTSFRTDSTNAITYWNRIYTFCVWGRLSLPRALAHTILSPTLTHTT